ncbi:MAG: LysM peptidoglycan-binding domain-containing protein [Flavobacterium sp.]|nr:LysM peptidoglycan-binding domain-containing protein [Flavobacterium sp.]
MHFFKFFSVVLLLSCGSVFGQKIIKHKVKSGESIYSIARQYDVTEKEIYEWNPKLKGKVLGLKTIVEIQNKKFKEEEKKPKEKKKEEVVIVPALTSSNEPYIIHTVSAKETLYSLSKQYGISMEEICELNPELKTGNLKKGAKLKFPNTIKIVDTNDQIKAPKSVVIPEPIETVSTTNVIHKVQPKETLYRISKKYGVSVSELQRLNPTVTSGLPVGFDLVVKKGSSQVVETPKAIEETPVKTVEVAPLSMENMSKADFLIAKASQHLGTRYRSGGTSPGGFDCSGLMIATFQEIEMKLPRTSREQSNYGVSIDRSQAQKGDLIFFTTNGRGNINHVGMVTEVIGDEIKFIHSSIQAGVIISSTKEDYYAKRFVKVNRVLE